MRSTKREARRIPGDHEKGHSSTSSPGICKKSISLPFDVLEEVGGDEIDAPPRRRHCRWQSTSGDGRVSRQTANATSEPLLLTPGTATTVRYGNRPSRRPCNPFSLIMLKAALTLATGMDQPTPRTAPAGTRRSHRPACTDPLARRSASVTRSASAYSASMSGAGRRRCRHGRSASRRRRGADVAPGEHAARAKTRTRPTTN